MLSLCRAARAFLSPGCGHQASVTTGTIVQDTRSLCGCGFGPCGGWPPKRTAPAPWVCNGLPGLRGYEKARTSPRKLPPGDGRSVFDRLAGTVEVDETYLSGPEESVRGRQTEKKPLVVVAAQEDGRGAGRFRWQEIPDALARNLIPFVEDWVEPGSVIHTDGWLGYEPLESDYWHALTFFVARR